MKIFYPTSVNYTELMNSAQPARLIAECIAGNEAAIEALIRQYETGVFRFALSIVGDPADANEITQETFLAMLRSLKNYKEQTSFKAWLYTIVLNLSRSHLRKRKAIERLHTSLTSLFKIETQKQTLPEEAFLQTEQEALIWQELNTLDERHRIVVILRYFHDLSIHEISEILNVNEGTLHSRLYTARERLRKTLGNLHGD